MIIWGSKAVQKQVAEGNFYCPGCRNDSSYAHIRVSRYFTLYFIPLFPTTVLGEAIRCNNCGGDYKPEVLSYSRQALEAAVQPWPCSKCGNSNPANEAACLRCGDWRIAQLPSSQPETKSSYYLHRNGAQEGPLTMADILAGRQRGIFSDVDLIWNDDKNQWSPLGEFLAGR